jgi:hypothetical protein
VAPECAALLQRLAGKELLPQDAPARSLRLAETDGASGRLEFQVDEPVKQLGRRLESIFEQREGEEDDGGDEPGGSEEGAPQRMEARAR